MDYSRREIHQTAPTPTPTQTPSVAPFPAPLSESENDERNADRCLVQKKEEQDTEQLTAAWTKRDFPPTPTMPLSDFSKAARGNVSGGAIRRSTRSFWPSAANPPESEYLASGAGLFLPSPENDSGHTDPCPFPCSKIAFGESSDLLRPRHLNNRNLHPALQENQPLNAPRLRIRPFSSRKETKPFSSRKETKAAPITISIPQLRIKPTTSKKDMKLSSPLARRGAAERAYLQCQLKAEKLRRQKQDHFNEQRKLREIAKTAFAEGVSNEDKPDGVVLRLADEFKRFKGLDLGPLGTSPRNVRKGRSDMRQFGPSSPPALLVKSFKRSVSDILNDSGICEDRDLLFFPDGVPLPLKDKDDSLPEDAVADVDSEDSLHERSSLSKGDDWSESEPVDRSVSQESSSTDELSPSSDDSCIIGQLGTSCCDDAPPPSDLFMLTRKGNKKVTLRPKMNIPKHNATGESRPLRKPESIGTCGGLGRLSPRIQMNDSGQNDGCYHGGITTSEESEVKFLSPDKAHPFTGDAFVASGPFSLLSSDPQNPTENDCDDSRDDSLDIKQQLFVFSSPDAGFFCTPDSRRPCRKHLCMRMPKLPELGVPDAIINLEAVSEIPDAAVARGVEDEPSVLEMSSLLLREPLSESNFCTPDHSFNDRITLCKRLDEAMPKMPNLEGISRNRESLDALDGTVGIKSMVEPDSSPEGQSTACPAGAEDIKSFLFCTPDNSYTER